MRWSLSLLSIGSVMAGFVLTPAVAQTQRACGVLDGPGCASVCGVFDGPGCISEQQPALSDTLRTTILSRAAAEAVPPDRDINTLAELFAALRACWRPPASEDAFPGMQVTVRLAFNREGHVIGKPRMTFATPIAPPRVRSLYLDAIAGSLEACAPFALTTGFAGAIAGRPIFIRFVDDRGLKKA